MLTFDIGLIILNQVILDVCGAGNLGISVRPTIGWRTKYEYIAQHRGSSETYSIDFSQPRPLSEIIRDADRRFH